MSSHTCASLAVEYPHANVSVDRERKLVAKRSQQDINVLDNVLLEHGGLHCVLPCAVLPDLGHPPDTQEYLGLLSEPFNTTQTF